MIAGPDRLVNANTVLIIGTTGQAVTTTTHNNTSSRRLNPREIRQVVRFEGHVNAGRGSAITLVIAPESCGVRRCANRVRLDEGPQPQLDGGLPSSR